jgi:stress response protein YsnF
MLCGSLHQNNCITQKQKIMAQTVIGIFDNRNNAEQAVERLVAQGYGREEIDISMHSNERSYGSGSGSDTSDSSSGEGFGDKISRFFSNLFDDEDESTRYTTIARSGTVVSVQTESSSMATRAAEILDECGAIDVDEQSMRTSGITSSDSEPSFGASVSPGTPVASADSFDEDLTDVSARSRMTEDIDNRSIPVIKEDLQVGKREVEGGGVRLRSRIIERPVERSLRLREEHVSIDRTPTNRPASESDFNTFREGEIEVRERSEVPIVNKEARVVEEINLRKDVREREETVRETVRETEVDIDKIEGDDDDMLSSTTRRSKL